MSSSDHEPCKERRFHFTRNHVVIRDPDEGAITLLEISDLQRELIDWVLFGLPESDVNTEDQLLQILVKMGIRKW